MSEPEPNRPGSILRAEREALGVSVREVAETLNLSMTVIEAIEADDQSRLPGPVFARGYVRAYARLLELPPEPLVAQYPAPPEAAPPVAAAAEAPLREWIRRRPGLVLGGGATAAVLLMALLVASLWPDGDPEPATAAAPAADTASPSADGATGAYATSDESAPGVADALEAFRDDAADGDASPASAGDLAEAMDPAPSAAAGNAAVEDVASPVTPAAEGADHRITPTGDDRLSFEFAEDCWVEVRDAEGRRLYSDLSRADTRLELLGQGPFRILLGYAPGVRLAFNGEAVSLAPHTRDNVATLVLGQ